MLKGYSTQLQSWPVTGKHIMAQFDHDCIVVYQAFNKSIADYAVAHQVFGGPFSFGRMSWIKPNFLWMMYRCGWASKENQEAVLAIRITREGFDTILSRAIHSTFIPPVYHTEDDWHRAGAAADVRLQWDPDHNPYGSPLPRKAIQLGLRGHTLRAYATDWIVRIEDITDFVIANSAHVKNHELDQLLCPVETVYEPKDPELVKRIFS